MIQYFMKQYLFLLWGITSLIFSSLFLACSDDEPGDKTPVFTIKEEYLQQDFDQKQSSLVIPVETNLAADAWVVSSNQDWCVAAKDMSGSSPVVKVLVHANEEPDVRSAEITLKSSVQNYTSTSIRVRSCYPCQESQSDNRCGWRSSFHYCHFEYRIHNRAIGKQ